MTEEPPDLPGTSLPIPIPTHRYTLCYQLLSFPNTSKAFIYVYSLRKNAVEYGLVCFNISYALIYQSELACSLNHMPWKFFHVHTSSAFPIAQIGSTD